MVRLREIQRTAAFAWSPGASKPLIVTGTRAGAVDADFSDETKLELWDLSLDEAEQGAELQPVASIASDARFYDLAWGQPDDKYAKGIIAGALESGSLDLYDAAKLLAGASAEEALISRSTKHSGPIKSLQFNPIKSHYLATAGAKSELFVYDVNDMASPFRLGTATARPDDLECVAWNRKVAHILASGSAGGLVTVWDLKTKKTSVTLNNNRKAVSAIEWDPNYSTKLVTASYDDTTPIIYLWDLRNSNAPERTMQGHVQGVLSLSWCPQDPDLLLSCGKDSRTLVWNPQTGELYGEFQEGTNWNFSTRFNPHNPAMLATASFDGKLVVQTLQNTNQPAPEATVQSGLDGEDFFASAQTQPKESSFTLAKAPKWMERPVGASFGFGGKLVVFKPAAAGAAGAAATGRTASNVVITQFSADTEIAAATDKFEQALAAGDLASFCAAKEAEAKSDDEKADWTVIKTLSGGEVRDSIVKFLGFSKEEEESKDEKEESKDENEDKDDKKKDDGKDDDDDFFGGDDGEVDEDDFLANLAASKTKTITTDPFSLFDEAETHAEQDVTAALVLGNFAKAVDLCIGEKRWADAFLIANCGGPALVDKVQAGYLAQQQGKPSYIRLLGSVIAKDLWDVVNNANLDDWRQTMAMLCTFAADADFADLCEALGDRLLAAEAGDRKDASLCYVVGGKLDKAVGIWIAEMEETREAELATAGGSSDSSFAIHARSLQGLIEKVTVFRAVAKVEDKDASASSAQTADWKLAALYDKYTEYADLVAEQGKLAVAQKYLDLLPATYPAADIARERVKLATSSSKKVAAATATATKRALPGAAAAAAAAPAVRQPVVQPRAPSAGPYAPVAPMTAATNAYAPAAAPASQAANPYAPARAYGAPAAAPAPAPAPAAANPYAPAAPAASANPYAPAASTVSANPYAPTIPPAAPQYGGYAPAVPAYGAPQQNFSAPPQNTPPAASIAPPSKAKNMTVWNDVPMVTKPAARKAVPPVIKASPISSPFLPGANLAGPPPANPYGAPPSSMSTPPPPPKGPAPNRVTSPLAAPPRPSSTAANAYAPPPAAAAPTNAYAPPPPAASNAYAPPPPANAAVAPRVNSPYNAPPPAAAPPSNRYAPAPAAQTSQPPLPGMMAAPPQSTNPYGPPPTAAAAPHAANPYAPAGYQAGPPMGAPPMGAPQMSGPPMSGPPPMAARGPVAPPPRAGPPPMAAPPMATPPPPAAAAAPAAPAAAPAPATPHYATGTERTNIPANAQRMVEIFTRDMKRVAASAPATYSAQVKDTQKRINILFDCLNKGEMVKPDTIEQLATLAEALDGRDYATAQKIQTDIQTNKPDECGKWIVGVKRLLSMSKATP